MFIYNITMVYITTCDVYVSTIDRSDNQTYCYLDDIIKIPAE